MLSVAPVIVSVSGLATGAGVPTGGGGGGGGGGRRAARRSSSGATRLGHGEICPVGAPPLYGPSPLTRNGRFSNEFGGGGAAPGGTPSEKMNSKIGARVFASLQAVGRRG